MRTTQVQLIIQDNRIKDYNDVKIINAERGFIKFECEVTINGEKVKTLITYSGNYIILTAGYC